MRSVRDASFDVLRRLALTRVFCNPGYTELPMLAGLPADFEFLLSLQEASVVGMATGHALVTGAPALAIVHTGGGLGNAVGAIATARVNKAPVVIIAGQQDRRHLALEPFLAGELVDLAGRYPVWVEQPVRAADVPTLLVRAYHEAATRRGPAVLVVPMDDWNAPYPDEEIPVGPRAVARAQLPDDEVVSRVLGLLEASKAPALVAGTAMDSPAGWAALVTLAEKLRCPVWQEPFGSRAGFPQDHPQFAGHLASTRGGMRRMLQNFDFVLTFGGPLWRQYAPDGGGYVNEGTGTVVVTEDPAEAHRSHADLAVIGAPVALAARLASRVATRTSVLLPTPERAARPARPAPGRPMEAGHVYAALAAKLPPETVVLEETPSTRPMFNALMPIRRPQGYYTAAMSGLGFALPASLGVRLASPERGVVAVIGDGAAMYCIQALWSAAHYKVGALVVVLNNARYASMDMFSGYFGRPLPPWPGLTGLDLVGLATAQGCAARRIATLDELERTLDELVPGLPRRTEPLLLDVTIDAVTS